MRRSELRALGVELPLLPTVVLGALPGDGRWGERLYRLGLDVTASGAAEDTLKTWTAARDASGRRPAKARSSAPAELIAAGCVIVETVAPADGGYRIGDDEIVVIVDGADRAVEDPSAIARPIVEAARGTDPSNLWIGAGPGLHLLPENIVEEKLAALVEATFQARLALAKDQFDL
ncbi:MAG: hypothetical protein OEM67_12370 [Thermoleophilia bacterium]|nr:hypothetical protein [Thermoleophilia bacterium]MDH3725107.1 hypothetical protein [Thermoleophilia bacterium]